MDMKLLGNFIEIPLGVFIELTTQFISKFTPEQAVNIKVPPASRPSASSYLRYPVSGERRGHVRFTADSRSYQP